MSEVRSVGVKDGAELTDRVRTARTKKEGKALPPTPPPASEVSAKSRKLRRGGRRIEILVRDDRFVREVFERQRRADSVALAGQASECDEALFLFVDELRMGNSFESMWPQVSRYEPERKKRVDPRRSYSSTLLGTLSLLSRYTGACSGPQVAEVLLRDERWMQLLGFGLQEIREGSNARSLSLKGKTRDESNRFVSLPTNDDTPSEPDGEVKGTQSTTEESNRGALSSQSVADFEGQLNAGELESWFNRLIASCASNGLFPRVIDGVIDATDLETPERFEGAGMVKKKRKVVGKAHKPKQVESVIHGFKVCTLFDPVSKLPLAVRFDRIETADIHMARGVVDQARANLGKHAALRGVIVDRGFLAGDLLSWFAVRGLNWCVPSKRKMEVTIEAHRRVLEALGVSPDASRLVKDVVFTDAQMEAATTFAKCGQPLPNGVRFLLREGRSGTLPLLVAQVDHLVCTAFYRANGSEAEELTKKDLQITPLHATVVLRWPGQKAKAGVTKATDAGVRPRKTVEENNSDDEPVHLVLLSPHLEDALDRYDRYDTRSVIENCLHRDAKQHFGLGDCLKRTEAGMRSATYFALAAIAIHRAGILHKAKAAQETKETKKKGEAPKPVGVLQYRRDVAARQRNKLILVVDGRYAIVSIAWAFAVAGIQLAGATAPIKAPA